MSTSQQCKRKRAQMRNGYAHLAEQKRPKYRQRDWRVSAAKLARIVAKEHQRAANKGKKQ